MSTYENHTQVEDSSNGLHHFPFLVYESQESFYHSVHKLIYGPDHNSTGDESFPSYSSTHVKWISATSVCIVVIAYFCFMTAWGRHKRKQDQQHLLNRRQEALAPFQLYSAICMSSQLPRPPSYAQATGLYDLPPSYELVAAAEQQKAAITATSPQGVVNVALDIEEEEGQAEGSAVGTNDKAGTSQ